jgi:hypothetical protein
MTRRKRLSPIHATIVNTYISIMTEALLAILRMKNTVCLAMYVFTRSLKMLTSEEIEELNAELFERW